MKVSLKTLGSIVLALTFIGLIIHQLHFDDRVTTGQLTSNSVKVEVSNLGVILKSKTLELQEHSTPRVSELTSIKNNLVLLNCSESDIETEIAKIEQQFPSKEQLLNSFKVSPNLSSQLAYAIHLSDPKEKLVQLHQLSNKHPKDKLLAALFLDQCAENTQHVLCQPNTIVDISAANEANGSTWYKVANLEVKRGNIAAVIGALEQVIAATHFTEYWTQAITHYNQALIDTGYENVPGRILASVGFVAALPTTNLLHQFCGDRASQSTDIEQLCLSVGKKLVTYGKTMQNQLLGYGLQKSIYEARHDVISAQQVSANIDTLRQKMLSSPLPFELMLFDPQLFSYWLEQLNSVGELEAFKALNKEVDRLSGNPDYNPCPTPK